MVLVRDAFIDALTALGELLPMGKSLSPSAVALAWGLLPIQAKEQLDAEHMLYAMQQLQADPQPERDLSVTLQLLRYLFPLENGRPVYDRGLRSDLAKRMASPERFHALNAPAEARPAAEVIANGRLALPEGVLAQLDRVTRPLVLAAAAVHEIDGLEPSPFTAKQLHLGSQLAAACLIGRCSLEALRYADGRLDLAHEWIRTHPNGWAVMQTAAEAPRGSSRACSDGECPSAAAQSLLQGLAGPSEGLSALLVA